MDALISAQAGTALLIEGTKLASIHADAPEQAIPRCAEEVHLLFGEGFDLQVLQGVDRDQVVRRLAREAGSAEALQLSLILLDPEMPEEIRTEAAEELDGLLAEEECREGLERVLYAHPFPSEADLSGALAHSEEHAPHVRDLLRQLKELQPAIKDVRSAWTVLPDALFANPTERQIFQATLVREGIFRELVLVRSAGTSIKFFLSSVAFHPAAASFRGYRTLMRRWVAPFRETQRARPKRDENPLYLPIGAEALDQAAHALSGLSLHASSGSRIKQLFVRYRIPAEDAEDIIQESIVALIQVQHKLSDPEAWLFGTLRNRCILYWRDRRRKLFGIVDSAISELIKIKSSSAQELHSQVDLEKILGCIPEPCRNLLLLRYRLGYEPSEVAAKLGYSVTSVGKITTRCLAALSRVLVAEGIVPSSLGNRR